MARPEDLSTQLGDLSLLDPLDSRLGGPSARTTGATPAAATARYSTGGLLQDEDMSLAASGFDDLDLDDDLVPADEPDDPTVRIRRTSGPGGVEFGGSMAASTTTARSRAFRNDDHSAVARGTETAAPSLPANGSTSTIQDAVVVGVDDDDDERNEADRRREDQDELLVLDDEDCTEDDVLRIKQLRREREELRGINKVLRTVVASLKLTERNMNNVQAAAATSHDLLDLYSRILSQAEHTKDLILDPDWRGLEADEDYLVQQQQAALAERERERLEAEEAAERERHERQEQEELARRRRIELDELERRKRAPPTNNMKGGSSTTRGTGTGRGISRGSMTGARGLVRGTRARPMTGPTASARGGARAAATTDNGSASFSSTSSGIPTFSAGSTSGRGSAAVSGVRGVRGLRSRGGVSGIGRGGRGGSV